MILDIITAALIVVPMGIGMARGAAYILVRALGWIGAMAASFFLNPMLSKWLAAGPVGKAVFGALEEKIGGQADAVTETTEGLPQIISGTVSAAAQDAADSLVQAIGGLIISVIGFLSVVILIRLILTIFIRRSARINREGGRSPVRFINKLLGLLVGSVEGLLLAFLFLAALIPVMNMASPELSASIADGLKYSYLAGPLYDGNFLLVLASFKW